MPSDFRRAAGALEGTDEYAIKFDTGQKSCSLARLIFATLSKWKVFPPRMPARFGPLRLAVANEPDL